MTDSKAVQEMKDFEARPEIREMFRRIQKSEAFSFDSVYEAVMESKMNPTAFLDFFEAEEPSGLQPKLKDAVISDCGLHRYWLYRKTFHSPKMGRENYDTPQTCLFLMLNPSTADASVDDPTVKACMDFAGRQACHHLEIVNLFSFRSPSPKDIPYDISKACGPHWETFLREAIRKAHTIICGWGKHGSHLNQNLRVMEIIRESGKIAHCLNQNKDGSPQHPLYVSRHIQPVVYNL